MNVRDNFDIVCKRKWRLNLQTIIVCKIIFIERKGENEKSLEMTLKLYNYFELNVCQIFK
jgi:hypothetical protein